MQADTVEIRVRYAETDQMGHVYNSHFLTYFEVARTEYLRKRCGRRGLTSATRCAEPATASRWPKATSCWPAWTEPAARAAFPVK
jgi:hypothetical protein